MELNTASAVIGFARKLEEDGAGFYETLASRFKENSEILLACARENKKNIVQVERTYYGVISDALDGTFSFKLDTDSYIEELNCADTDRDSSIKLAIELENKTAKFYTDAGKQSLSLLADLSRVLTFMARKREARLAMLQSL